MLDVAGMSRIQRDNAGEGGLIADAYNAGGMDGRGGGSAWPHHDQCVAGGGSRCPGSRGSAVCRLGAPALIAVTQNVELEGALRALALHIERSEVAPKRGAAGANDPFFTIGSGCRCNELAGCRVGEEHLAVVCRASGLEVMKVFTSERYANKTADIAHTGHVHGSGSKSVAGALAFKEWIGHDTRVVRAAIPVGWSGGKGAWVAQERSDVAVGQARATEYRPPRLRIVQTHNAEGEPDEQVFEQVIMPPRRWYRYEPLPLAARKFLDPLHPRRTREHGVLAYKDAGRGSGTITLLDFPEGAAERLYEMVRMIEISRAIGLKDPHPPPEVPPALWTTVFSFVNPYLRIAFAWVYAIMGLIAFSASWEASDSMGVGSGIFGTVLALVLWTPAVMWTPREVRRIRWWRTARAYVKRRGERMPYDLQKFS